jgi:hypothetical protein
MSLCGELRQSRTHAQATARTRTGFIAPRPGKGKRCGQTGMDSYWSYRHASGVAL